MFTRVAMVVTNLYEQLYTEVVVLPVFADVGNVLSRQLHEYSSGLVYEEWIRM